MFCLKSWGSFAVRSGLWSRFFFHGIHARWGAFALVFYVVWWGEEVFFIIIDFIYGYPFAHEDIHVAPDAIDVI